MALSKIFLILLLILAGIFAVFVSFYASEINKSPVKTAEQNAKALIGGPFSLVNHHGKDVTHEDFKGKYMLVYFGYAYCPDICPMDLQIMSEALDQLPPAVLSEITPIFITVDPNRDTVEIMAQYVPAFHENMIGLTGSEEQTKAAKKSYRVYAAREKIEEGADPDSYLVNHSAFIYLMDRAGEYVTHFRSMADPAQIAERLQKIIR